MLFSSLTPNQYELWKSFWEKTRNRTADCTFFNLYGWALAYGIEYAVENDLFWVRSTKGEKPVYWYPLGNTDDLNWDTVLADFPSGSCFERIPISLAEQIQSRCPRIVNFSPTRDQDEYLYERTALADFTGRKLHKKRSHLNAYERLYGTDFRPLSKKDIPSILALSEEWLLLQEPQNPSLKSEYTAIERMLSLWDLDDSVCCGGLFVEGKLIAYDFGSAMDDKTFVIHIEKGLPQYRGVYPSIVKNFAGHSIPPTYETINREQDLGEEGLRHSKMTYQPSGFLQKACFSLS